MTPETYWTGWVIWTLGAGVVGYVVITAAIVTAAKILGRWH